MKRTVKSADTMVSLVEAYLAERRCLGFDLRISGQTLIELRAFRGCHGALRSNH